MSAAKELQPFFPSATHSGIPVAAQILSTLRALTGPGKGNSLKPQESAALVGVSALLACEKIQSNDLLELSAQRLASVAPSHFKSALAASRRILANNETRTRSRTSSATSSPTNSPHRGATFVTASPSSSAIAERTPFKTPTKKFKYMSGLDVSGLLSPHKHSPASASPLRLSVTPSKRKRAAEEREVEEEEEEDQRTPKRPTVSLTDRLSAARKAKEREGAAAFFALRPGMTPAGSSPSAASVIASYKEQFGYDPLASLGLGDDEEIARKVRRIQKRNDWTFKEKVWGCDSAAVEEILGPVVRVPDLIVTDDEEVEPRRTRTTPNKSPKKTKRTPKGKGTARGAADGPSLDSIIMDAWAL